MSLLLRIRYPLGEELIHARSSAYPPTLIVAFAVCDGGVSNGSDRIKNSPLNKFNFINLFKGDKFNFIFHLHLLSDLFLGQQIL